MESKFLPFQNDYAGELFTDYKDCISKRRSIREFSDRPVDLKLVNEIIKIASLAPSGANKQPWHFCLVTDPEIKKEIRKAAELEEYENYTSRMSKEWLDDLKQFGTNWQKEFLQKAPVLIVVFKKIYDLDEEGNKQKNYYVSESVGIGCGFLINAIHMAGLVTLTHTPSPMDFLQKILKRPLNEKPFLLLPVGWPDENATVPDIKKKSIDEVCTYY